MARTVELPQAVGPESTYGGNETVLLMEASWLSMLLCALNPSTRKAGDREFNASLDYRTSARTARVTQ